MTCSQTSVPTSEVEVAAPSAVAKAWRRLRSEASCSARARARCSSSSSSVRSSARPACRASDSTYSRSRRAEGAPLREREADRPDRLARDGERDREPGAEPRRGRELGVVDRELGARPVDEELVPCDRHPERGLRPAIEALPALELLRRESGRGDEDEVVAAQPQKRSCRRAQRRLRLLEGGGADELGGRRGPERLRRVQEPPGVVGASVGCLLCPAPLGVLERQSGMVGEPPGEDERLGAVGRQVLAPDHPEHAPHLVRDDDGDLEGGAVAHQAERPLRVDRALHRGPLGERRLHPCERLLEAGHVGAERAGARRAVVVGRLLVDEHGLLLGERPELGDVPVEGGERLPADSLHDGHRPLAREARREAGDPVEALAERPLPIVELRALERLAAESRRELRERDQLGVDAPGRVEREAHRADDAVFRQQRHGERAVRVVRESGPVRVLALHLLARVGVRRLPGEGRPGDRRLRAEWNPEPRRQGRPAHASGVDDDELVVLNEPESAADRAEQWRHALDEGVRDLVGRRSRRELGRQRSERMCLGLDPGAALL